MSFKGSECGEIRPSRALIQTLIEAEDAERITLDGNKSRRQHVRVLLERGFLETHYFFKEHWRTGYALTRSGREALKVLRSLSV
jgi:hypothetical protein